MTITLACIPYLPGIRFVIRNKINQLFRYITIFVKDYSNSEHKFLYFIKENNCENETKTENDLSFIFQPLVSIDYSCYPRRARSASAWILF